MHRVNLSAIKQINGQVALGEKESILSLFCEWQHLLAKTDVKKIYINRALRADQGRVYSDRLLA